MPGTVVFRLRLLTTALGTLSSVAGTPCVFLSGLYHAEQSVAEHLRRVTGGPVPWPAIDAIDFVGRG